MGFMRERLPTNSTNAYKVSTGVPAVATPSVLGMLVCACLYCFSKNSLEENSKRKINRFPNPHLSTSSHEFPNSNSLEVTMLIFERLPQIGSESFHPN